MTEPQHWKKERDLEHRMTYLGFSAGILRERQAFRKQTSNVVLPLIVEAEHCIHTGSSTRTTSLAIQVQDGANDIKGR